MLPLERKRVCESPSNAWHVRALAILQIAECTIGDPLCALVFFFYFTSSFTFINVFFFKVLKGVLFKEVITPV
jgi:hypothetical protein